MKYFTPDLFIQFQECEDTNTFRAINASWEDAIRRYRERLREIRSTPKDGVLEFARQKSLHDAQVMDIGVSEKRLTIVLQEPIRAGLVSLIYALVDSPSIDRSAIPETHRSSPTLWLYDEIDRDEETEGNQPEDKPLFLHSILLSNGWAIRVRFHRILVTRTTSLLRSPEFSPGAEAALTHSA